MSYRGTDDSGRAFASNGADGVVRLRSRRQRRILRGQREPSTAIRARQAELLADSGGRQWYKYGYRTTGERRHAIGDQAREEVPG